MGRPGSGKGTQAELLAQKIDARIISLGKEFRELVANGSHLGVRLKESLEAGHLAPTWLADYVCKKELLFLEPEEQVVFDSGCRIKSEAVLFHDIHDWFERTYQVIYIDVSEEEIVRRIHVRRGLEGRADDAHSSIHKRVEEFENKTMLSIEYFESIGKLARVSGEGSPEDVHAAILKTINLA